MTSRSRLREPLARAIGKPAKRLATLGLHTVEDLLRHFPRRYSEPGNLTDFASLQVGEHVTVTASVAHVNQPPFRGGTRRLEVGITDGMRNLELVFFAKNQWGIDIHRKRLVVGAEGTFTGTLGEFRGRPQLVYPDYLIVGDRVGSTQAAEEALTRPVPIYPAANRIPTWTIRQCVDLILDTLEPSDFADPLDENYRRAHNLLGMYEAFEAIHRPGDLAVAAQAATRFRHEEAVVLQAALALRRAEVADLKAIARPLVAAGLRTHFDRNLPFTLTTGQAKVGERVAQEMAKPHPMHMLVQGDVGSGKTLVALRAMLQVVDSGGQAALLAPTEVLAAQHFDSITAALGDLATGGQLGAHRLATSVELLVGNQGARTRRETLAHIESGQAGIVIGTHALLSQTVRFADLGIVVIDEQHRFGVEQRDVLRSRGKVTPHVLVMTATPIPRTVAMTVFGDLDIVTLDEIPAGRGEVQTHVVSTRRQSWVERVWDRLAEEIAAGGRAFVVCPRIDGEDGRSESVTQAEAELEIPALGAGDRAATTAPGESHRLGAAVMQQAAYLRSRLPHIGQAIMHGRLQSSQKADAMASFISGETPILVTTTVIEVGVNVTEASVMVILDADRYGLAQLHQLRGRIGRGQRPGLCFLLADVAPQSEAAARLAALARSRDGQELARIDLELRKEGDVLGVGQSGRSSLRWLRLSHDETIIQGARDYANGLVAKGLPSGLRAAVDDFMAAGSDQFLVKS